MRNENSPFHWLNDSRKKNSRWSVCFLVCELRWVVVISVCNNSDKKNIGLKSDSIRCWRGYLRTMRSVSVKYLRSIVGPPTNCAPQCDNTPFTAHYTSMYYAFTGFANQNSPLSNTCFAPIKYKWKHFCFRIIVGDIFSINIKRKKTIYMKLSRCEWRL